MVSVSAALVWFRRDLRAHDHAALHSALAAHGTVHCAFVFDREILDPLPTRVDRRVEFIWESVRELKAMLEAMGGGLWILHGQAREEIPALALQLGVGAVYANRDYEPAALARDADVARTLAQAGTTFARAKTRLSSNATRSGRARGGRLFGLHSLPECLARQACPESLRGAADGGPRGETCTRPRRGPAPTRGPRLLAHQSFQARDRARRLGRGQGAGQLQASNRPLRRAKQLPGVERDLPPFDPPTLRDRVGP